MICSKHACYKCIFMQLYIHVLVLVRMTAGIIEHLSTLTILVSIKSQSCKRIFFFFFLHVDPCMYSVPVCISWLQIVY